MTSADNDLPLAAITVTYSPGRLLGAMIDSLDEATSRKLRLVVADNGSTDGAPERAAQRPGVELYHTGGNIGYGPAINAAARRLRAPREEGEVDPEFFLVVNPDVEFSPGSIDALLECARRRPRAGSLGPLIREPDGEAYPSARALPTLGVGVGHALLADIWPNNPWTRRYRAGSDLGRERAAGWLSGACLLLRWDAFEELGGFDERYFMYFEDVDLGDRLGRAGWESVFYPGAEITHAQGHAAKGNRGITVPAHHRSAYRYFADRHAAWWQAPLRLAVGAGLAARSVAARLVVARR